MERGPPGEPAFDTPFPVSDDSSRALLAAGLEELSLEIRADQLEALLALARLVESWSARINLTGHRGLRAIVQGLILEAVALATRLPEVGSLADLGSGAGFPGLPLAILRPRCRVTLVEARQRRHHFQRAACRSLEIANATPLQGRAEQLEPELHDAVVAQAMARPSRALQWMVPWCRIGGLLVLPLSAGSGHSPSDERVSGGQRWDYRVPCGGPDRTLWIGRRLR